MPYSNITFTIEPDKSFKANDFIKVSHDASNYVTGRVVSYNNSTGQLVITPYESVGSGTYTSWTAELTGHQGSSGDSSSSGTTGTSGIDGSSGTNGTTGTSGTSGTTGFSGTSGTNGTNGIPGASGESASSGISGTTGTNGTGGTSGSNGSTGTSGTVGTSGGIGSSGASGSTGTSGTSGATTTDGASGSAGVSTSSGTSGATGPQGPVGAPGSQGPIGAQGPRGPQGGQGPQGARGPTGPTGPTGAPGGTGPTGGSTSYNQGLYTYSAPTFGSVSVSGGVYTSTRMYVGNYGRLTSSANQGLPWIGFSSGWYTTGAVGSASRYGTSSRTAKTDIQTFSPSALSILNDTDIVTYNFDIDQNDENKTIGFIAEDTHELLSGNDHNRMDTTSVIGLLLKSVQEISDRITNLENKKNNAI